MSEEIEYYDDTPPPAGAEMTLIETWIAVLTKPKKETFVQIAAQSRATLGNAFLWAFLSILVSSFANFIAQAMSRGNMMSTLDNFLPPEMAGQLLPMGATPSLGFGTIICGAPIAAIMGIFGFAIGVALIQWVAKLFGGTGSFEKLAYAFSMILFPYAIISAVLTLLSAIPVVGLCFGVVTIGLAIYQLVLQILAVQAVNNLDTGKAIGAIILPGFVIFILICCCLVLFGTLLAPMLGNMYNNMPPIPELY